MKNKLFLFLILGFLLISVVSANGLEIINQSSFSIDKIYGQDKVIDIQIKNVETFEFRNVSISINPYVSMVTIPSIQSGEIYNTSITVKTNENIDKDFNIKGLYYTNTGGLNDSYNINIDYEDGFSVCGLTVVEGDSITWFNNNNFQVTLKNADTNNDIKIMEPNTNYTLELDYSQVINYYAIRAGFQFTDVCSLVVLDDEGYVNDPNKDAVFNLKTNVLYNPTTIQVSFIETSYNMSFYGEQQGIFTVKNVGTETARDIHLEGEWFEFSTNDFSLEPGYSRNIGYTISPLGYITETNQTGEEYTKVLKVTGNFPEFNQEFKVFVSPDNVGEGSGNFTYADIRAYIEYCNMYPDDELCPEPTIIYKYADNGSLEFNYSMSKEQQDGLFRLFFDLSDNVDNYLKFFKENNQNVSDTLQSVNNTMGNLDTRITSLEEESTKSREAWIFWGILMGAVILGVLFALILNKKMKHRKLKDLGRKY